MPRFLEAGYALLFEIYMGMGMPHADVLDTLAPHILFGPTPAEAEGAANVPEVSENEPVPTEADNNMALQDLEQMLRGLGTR